MKATRYGVRSRRVVAEGRVGPALLVIEGERIAALASFDAVPTGIDVVDCGDDVVMPGLVDSHVHVNEPGRTEWEGFATATRAAALGGITTLADMPLNSSPVTTTVAALEAKRRAAAGQLAVDVGFVAGVVPGNADQLSSLMAAGVLAAKAFLIDSGIPEFPPVDEGDLDRALPLLAAIPLFVHAEVGSCASFSSHRYADFLASRPPRLEAAAVELAAKLAQRHDRAIHIVHVAAAEAVEAIRRARASGVAISGESCPHYLTLSAEDIPDRATHYKCCPPIRERSHREALWAGLLDGTLGLIVSDHSPCPPELKRREVGDFGAAWGGIGSLGLGLPLIWTEMRSRGIPLERIEEWMAAAPARLLGLDRRKGALAPGFDADLVIWDPEATWTIRESDLGFRHRISPHLGREVRGWVRDVFLRGRQIVRRGELLDATRGLELVRARA